MIDNGGTLYNVVCNLNGKHNFLDKQKAAQIYSSHFQLKHFTFVMNTHCHQSFRFTKYVHNIEITTMTLGYVE